MSTIEAVRPPPCSHNCARPGLSDKYGVRLAVLREQHKLGLLSEIDWFLSVVRVFHEFYACEDSEGQGDAVDAIKQQVS